MNPIDIIVYTFTLLPFLVASLIAVFVPESWMPWKIATIIGVDVLAFSLVTLFFFEKWLAKPDFVTTHRTAFWTNGITELTPELMEKALDMFLVKLPTMTNEVSREELLGMLRKTGIEWKTQTVGMIWGSHHLKGKAGVQIGYRLLIQWKGSVAKSAFYHELLHEVNENIRLPRLPSESTRAQFREYDIQHREAEWWALADVLDDGF